MFNLKSKKKGKILFLFSLRKKNQSCELKFARVTQRSAYQWRGLLPSLSGASKSAPYLVTIWFKKPVCPYWAATWTAWCKNSQRSWTIILKSSDLGIIGTTKYWKSHYLTVNVWNLAINSDESPVRKWWIAQKKR